MRSMTEDKEWYESKGVWGGVITVLASVSGAFGVTISMEEQEMITGLAVTTITGISGLVSLIGRLVADKKIRRKGGK